MLANPVTSAANGVADLFPAASPPHAFSFRPADGYQSADLLENGVGYWVKFPAATVQPVSGDARTRDTLTVEAGWNMIGGISCPVDTGATITVPPGIRATPFYGYNGVYAGVPTLEPGRAYWVKMSAPGQLILSCYSVASPGQRHMQKELR
jgi:hypothetical protein